MIDLPQDLFGGIQNNREVLHWIKSALLDSKIEMYTRLKEFNFLTSIRKFGEIITTQNDANIILEEKWNCPISGKILHVEQDKDGKYNIFQATEKRLIVDTVDNNGKVIRKDFIINIKNASKIINLDSSENFYIIVDEDNNIHLAPKDHKQINENSITIRTQAYIGDELQFDADITSVQIFEYKNLIIIYLFNVKDKIIYRLHIDQTSYKLINYDIIDALSECEIFDSRAIFYLDAYVEQNNQKKIDPHKVVYLRNNGSNIIIGHKNNEDQLVHSLLSTDNTENIKEICSFITEKDWIIDKILQINLQDKSVLLAIQTYEDSIQYKIFDYNGNLLSSEDDDIDMSRSEIITLLSKKQINMRTSKLKDIIKNLKTDTNIIDTEEDTEEEYDEDNFFSNIEYESPRENYEYDFTESNSFDNNLNSNSQEIAIKLTDNDVKNNQNNNISNNQEEKSNSDINATKIT